ncbi:MAG: hypothetical protein NC548_10710 [Lachnospiraceae bacterium]|nr:hypothetical protein [Lachnospiraceae bacterium]
MDDGDATVTVAADDESADMQVQTESAKCIMSIGKFDGDASEAVEIPIGTLRLPGGAGIIDEDTGYVAYIIGDMQIAFVRTAASFDADVTIELSYDDVKTEFTIKELYTTFDDLITEAINSAQ